MINCSMFIPLPFFLVVECFLILPCSLFRRLFLIHGDLAAFDRATQPRYPCIDALHNFSTQTSTEQQQHVKGEKRKRLTVKEALYWMSKQRGGAYARRKWLFNQWKSAVLILNEKKIKRVYCLLQLDTCPWYFSALLHIKQLFSRSNFSELAVGMNEL